MGKSKFSLCRVWGKNEAAEFIPWEISKEAADENRAFLDELREILESNLSNPKFNVEALCRQLCMGHSTIYRKLKDIFGVSPCRFIRTCRLYWAAQLLENKLSNVSEVAVKVGFTNFSYFTKCFKKKFRQLPSHYKVSHPGNYFKNSFSHVIDDAFLKEMEKELTENFSDPTFNVKTLSQKLLIGRTTLYMRSLALTGQTPTQLIRSFRLKRAAKLLRTGFCSVTDVAFEVGFTSTSHFTRCFKREYHRLPSTFKTTGKR